MAKKNKIKTKGTKSNQTQSVFVCTTAQGAVAVAVAYGRGHAVKQIAKVLEAQGLTLEKTDTVVKLENSKSHAVLLRAPNLKD